MFMEMVRRASTTHALEYAWGVCAAPAALPATDRAQGGSLLTHADRAERNVSRAMTSWRAQ